MQENGENSSDAVDPSEVDATQAQEGENNPENNETTSGAANQENGQGSNQENTQESNQENNGKINSKQTSSEAMGGPEESTQVGEKTQEEQDVDYVKQNSNIIWPLRGVITSRYGSRTPTAIVSANHRGLDIAGNTGDTIISAMDGTVVLASGTGDYGNHIQIENGEITTLYAHCSELLVQKGATVKQGDIIAKVGQTGRATGPHLHFEIRRDGRFINPEQILGSL